MALSYSAPGVYVETVPSGTAPIAGVGTSTPGFIGAFPDTVEVPNPEYDASITAPNDARSKATLPQPIPTHVGEVRLVTNFTEFKKSFGGFSLDEGHAALAHAVYGFFLNGGTSCYVTRAQLGAGAGWTDTSLAGALELLEPFDDISMVLAPGMSGATPYTDLVAHCVKMRTRMAIIDTAATYGADVGAALTELAAEKITASAFVALYFPWIEVHDPLTGKSRYVPPSGHIAGIYARVDTQRGVHKAPANETVLGALDLKYAISTAQQEKLNPQGVNCIRRLNGNITVWGARTAGGTKNGDFTYVNVRRLFNYLIASIDAGTQWAVFEPNTPELWAKITRNVTAFLTTVWSAGALFGAKAEDAFYVKCDAETNPPETRDLGMVVTEVGVAITRPAEFVIFRLGQKAAK